MKRWDLCWADVKFADSEQSKRRPVLIANVNDKTGFTVTFKITSQKKDNILQYFLIDWAEEPLDKPCYVNLYQKIKFDNIENLTLIGPLTKRDIDNIKAICKDNGISFFETIEKDTFLNDKSLNKNNFTGVSYEDTFEDWYQRLSQSDQIKVDEIADDMELPNYEDCMDYELAQLHDNFVTRYNLEEAITEENKSNNSILPFSYTDDQLTDVLQKKLNNIDLDSSITITNNYGNDNEGEWWDEKDFPITYFVRSSTQKDGSIQVTYGGYIDTYEDISQVKIETFTTDDLIEANCQSIDELADFIIESIDFILDSDEMIEQIYNKMSN